MRSTRLVVANVAVLALLATACSSSDDATANTDSPPATVSTAAVDDTTVDDTTVDDPTVDDTTVDDTTVDDTTVDDTTVDDTTVDDTTVDDGAADPYATVGPADDSLEPITIGFMTWVGLPEVETGFELGVRWVNEELGGIDGQPLEYIACPVELTPESSIACANQFIEAGVSAVAVSVDLAAGAALPVLADAGIVMLQSGDLSPQLRERTGDAYFEVTGARDLVLGDALIIAEQWDVDSIAFLTGDASGEVLFDTMVAASEMLGFEVVGGLIQWDPVAPDWDSIAATVVASGAEGVVIPILDDGGCIGLLSSLAAFGFQGPRLAGGCGLFRTILPPEISVGVYGNNPWIPADAKVIPDAMAGDVDALVRYLADSGNDDLFGGFVEYGFMHPPWIRDVIANADDPSDAASVHEGAATASGTRRPFSVSPWNCDGSIDPTTSSCGSGAFVSIVDENLDRVIVSEFPIDLSPLEELRN